MKYLTYIKKTTAKGLIEPPFTRELKKNSRFYAKVTADDGALCFRVCDGRLEKIYPTQEYTDDRTICSLKWINTRNRFSLHILKSLLHYQSKYWLSGKQADLKPLTLREFILFYPAQYLDQSRLSRLLPNLLVVSPQGRFVGLRNLFISKRRYYAYLVEETIKNGGDPLKDKDIHYLLAQKGTHLSLRTICNCRSLLNIPSYRERAICRYEGDTVFGNYITLSTGHLKKIPPETGVYELSISAKIDYPSHKKSNVIYIGASKNLRKRMASYTGNNLKNDCLINFRNTCDVFVRFCLTENHTLVEKKLLRNFKNNYGQLPKANRLGG